MAVVVFNLMNNFKEQESKIELSMIPDILGSVTEIIILGMVYGIGCTLW